MTRGYSSAHEQNIAVTEAAAAATGRLADHYDVVYDGVLGPWFLERFLAAAGRSHLHYVVLIPPLVVCLARVRNREGHGFTDRDAASRMWHGFHRAHVDPRHVMHQDAKSPAEVARAIAGLMDNGTIRYP